MNLDFYADGADKADVLDFIFDNTPLRILDHYSNYSEEVREYRSTSEITARFDLHNGGALVAGFALWNETFKVKPVFRKVELDPKRCNGHTFRYTTDGVGLIRLYFGGLQHNCLRHTHLGHFNQKGAEKTAETKAELAEVLSWNWKEVESIGNVLRYYISKKMAVNKIGSEPVLKGAEALRLSGVTLRY